MQDCPREIPLQGQSFGTPSQDYKMNSLWWMLLHKIQEGLMQTSLCWCIAKSLISQMYFLCPAPSYKQTLGNGWKSLNEHLWRPNPAHIEVNRGPVLPSLVMLSGIFSLQVVPLVYVGAFNYGIELDPTLDFRSPPEIDPFKQEPPCEHTAQVCVF